MAGKETKRRGFQCSPGSLAGPKEGVGMRWQKLFLPDPAFSAGHVSPGHKDPIPPQKGTQNRERVSPGQKGGRWGQNPPAFFIAAAPRYARC